MNIPKGSQYILLVYKKHREKCFTFHSNGHFVITNRLGFHLSFILLGVHLYTIRYRVDIRGWAEQRQRQTKTQTPHYTVESSNVPIISCYCWYYIGNKNIRTNEFSLRRTWSNNRPQIEYPFYVNHAINKLRLRLCIVPEAQVHRMKSNWNYGVCV